MLAIVSSIVSCPAAEAQSVTASPTSVSFGNQAEGTTSPAKKITLKNGQSSPITISGISTTLSDYAATNNCPVSPATLAAGASCSISVTFTPSALGTRSTNLTSVDTGTSSPQVVALSGSGTAPTLVSMAVTPATPSVAAGNTEQFTATGTYSNGSTQNLTSTAEWNSSATTIAKISASGLATTVAPGTTTITAKSGAITGSATLTVTAAVLTSLSVTPASASVAAGNTQQFTATGTYSNGSTQNLSSTAKWSSSAVAVATVNSAGLATSVAPGTATIAATSGSVSGSATLTVTAAVLTAISVTPATPSVAAGNTQQFTATGSYSNGSTQNLTSTVKWTSSATTIATVSSAGLATAVAPGTTTITAKSGSITGSATLTVTAAVLTSLSVTPASASVAAGYTQQFTATGTYSNGSTQNLTSSAKWTSSATGIATINSGGLATSVASGTATVTATSGSISGFATLTVTAAVLTAISVTPATPSVAAGNTQQFTATGSYSNGSTQNLTSSANWSSSATTIAKISASGLATTVAPGTTTITAKSGAITGSATLTVTAAVLTSLSVTPASASVAAGNTQQFTATGKYSNGSTQNLSSTVPWSSSATGIATVNGSGLATSVAQGSATITASSGAISSSATLKVKAAVLMSISVTPTVASVAAGTTQQFTATGTYSNGSTQNLTMSVQWSSSVTSVATVNTGGMANAVAPGGTMITAASGTMSGSAAFTVTLPVLTSLSVTPATASIAKGTSRQFIATGTYSDGSTQNLTSLVSWSSSAGAATISAAGLATGEGVGAATITAASGAITASATLTVGQPVLVSLAVTPANPSFALGTTQALFATGTYSDGSTLDLTGQASWSTGDGSIATISAPGVATSVAVGSTRVSATAGAVSGATTITVSPAVLVSIAVTPAIPTIPLGTAQPFTATGSYTDGSTQNITGTVQWSSDTLTVATISNAAGTQGNASGVGQGSATITASVGSVTGSTTLMVSSAALVSIAVTPATPTLALGTQQQFTATGTFTDGGTQDLTSTATWTSDTPMAATINATGLAQSAGLGTATITATSGNISSSTQLTVTAAALVSIAITPPAAAIPLGMQQQFTAMGTFTDGSAQDVTQSGHWSSTVATVATISDTAGTVGLASTQGTGVTTIGISSNGVSAAATLTVNPAALVTIAISPQAPAIALGTSQQFTAMGKYTDGSAQDVTAVVNWSSSDATVAIIGNTVGSYGLATSSGQGSATITATASSLSSSTTITVGQATLSSLAVTPSSVSVALGYNEQFTAIATLSDDSVQDVTQSATWTSSTPTVAVVNSTGLAASLLVGTTNVSASFGAAVGSALLTVISPVPVSLVISPANPNIFVSGQQQFGATLNYSDGSFLNVTTAVTWNSSNPAVATVGATGLAVGMAGGLTEIAAKWGNFLTGSTALSVTPPTVSITPSSASLMWGATQQFSAGVTGSANQSVTWSVDGMAGGNSMLGTISSAGLYVPPPTIGSHAITAIAQANGASQGTATVTVGSLAALSNTFFGMHLLSLASPIPNTMVGTGRIWDSASAQWPNLNTASGTFVWTNLDAVLADYKAAGINDILYTLWRVPNWASSNKSDTSCDYAGQGANSDGECDLPTDLNADGTGTDLTWRTWVQNIAQHVNSAGYSSTHAHIGYWEACNECFRSPTLDPGYGTSGGSVAYKGTYAQLVRLMQDARCIILGNPNDHITALNTTCGQSGYPVTGIDPTSQMVMPSTGPLPTTGGKTSAYVQVMQNLLYCTCTGNSCSKSSTGCPTASAGSAAVDIINAHVYAKSYAPEQIPAEVASVRAALQAPDLAKPMWNGEGGWGQTSVATQVNDGDPDLEAAFIARFEIMAWASGLARSYWYEWDNSAHGRLWSPYGISGCILPFTSGYICAAGVANQQVYDWIVGSTLTSCSASGTTWTCGLTEANGTPAEIVWDTSQTCSNGVCGTLSYSAPPIYFSYRDLTGASFSIDGAVPIGIKPILLEVQ